MKHYKPILRWKRGEQKALENLTAQQKDKIFPLLNIQAYEFNPPQGNDYDSAFDKLIQRDAERLANVWGDYKATVDLGDLDLDAKCESGKHPVEEFFDIVYNKNKNASISPVIRTDLTTDYINAIISVIRKFGISPTFRITIEDLVKPNLIDFFDDLLSKIKKDKADCDLILDLKFVIDNFINHTTLLLQSAIPNFPYLSKWKTFTLTSGAFPENLAHLAPSNTYRIERIDWNIWLSLNKKISRDVLFGDYATIHPISSDAEIDFSMINTSASVRYTDGHEWVILRGRGVRSPNAGGYGQYRNHAKTIISSSFYRGQNFSFGDKKINSIASGQDGTGNPQTWVTISVNHHIAEALDQLSKLSYF